MKKIVALGGSTSRQSINKKWAGHVAGLIPNSKAHILDLNDYNLPLYSIDHEQNKGIPVDAHRLLEQIQSADGLVISLAEHNGCYTAAFKNAYDWMSRINKEVWNQVPMFLMATSPGGRGGATVLDIASKGFPFLGGNIIATFSLPRFYDVYSESGIQDMALQETFEEAFSMFQKAI